MTSRPPCVLALDVGTSAIKVGAFGLDGKLAAASEREQHLALVGERAEQSPAQTWSLLCDAVQEVTRATAPAEIVAISLSTHRGTVVPIGRDGGPLCNYILWMDRRGVPWTVWLAATVPPADYYNTCGHPIVSYTGISKILWLQREAPKLFEAAATIGPPQTLLLRQLGCEDDVCDLSAATFHFPLDIRDKRWSSSFAALIDFPLDKLPRLVAATDVVGRLGRNAARDLGLPPAIPLVPGGGDGQCAGAGSGAIRVGVAMVNVGTAAGVQAFLSEPLLDRNLTLNCAAHVIPDAWELEGHTQASGAVLHWLKRELSPTESYEQLVARVDGTPPCADGLLFLPMFNGSSAPHPDPAASGCLLGLRLTHTFGHIVRAALEGISLELRWMLDAIGEAGVDVSDVRLVGGGARNPRWNRIHADALGRPVSTLRVADAAMVGAAMCAAVAVGAYADLSAAADAFVRVEGTVEPDPASAGDYSELSERYRATFDLLSDAEAFTASQRDLERT